MKSISQAAKKKGPNVVVSVGDIGYKFRKEFDSGWFTGTVKQIRPLAEGGKDRRCVYDDGDSEDLSLMQLQILAIFDSNITDDDDDDDAHAGDSGVVLGGIWEKRFTELKQYKKKFGDTRVPRNYSNRVLASWVKKQKNYHNRLMEGQDKAFITPEKIGLLKSIGFVFRSNTRGRHVAYNHHGVKSDETVTSKARGGKSDDTVTSKALTHKIQKRRRNLEVTELSRSETRSRRTVRQPPKVDEIYSYEHMKFIYQRNKNTEAKDAKRDKYAKEAKETFFDSPHPGRKSHVTKSSMNPPTPPTPDRNLLSSLDYDIPVDAAAVSTLNFTRYDSEDDEKEWLEKMAASLGADTSAPRQKQMSLTHAPILKQLSLKPMPNPQSCIMKSDASSSYDYLVWDPYSAVVCEICAVNKDDNQVVICDECHKGFHTYCLRPVMVNIPREDWWCSVCSGRTNDQVSYEEFKTNLSSCTTQDILHFLGLPFDNPVEFFSRHNKAMGLFTMNSDAVVKQHAISHDVLTKSVVFGVDNIMFIRKPEKNDWRLPTPLLGESYRLSTLSMAASMKYCGMESNLLELVYAEPANEGMNDPALEVDTVVPMSKRNLEIYRAFLHNIKQGVLPPVEIIHDENFGFSVKSLGFMRQHTLISAYLGEVVTMEQSGLSSSDSLMVLLDTGNPQTSLIIDPTRAGNIARFLSGINNRSLLSRRKRYVRTRRFEMDGKMHVCLFTCRSVEAGEILNYDYNAGNEGKDIGQWTKTGFYDTSNFF